MASLLVVSPSRRHIGPALLVLYVRGEGASGDHAPALYVGEGKRKWVESARWLEAEAVVGNVF